MPVRLAGVGLSTTNGRGHAANLSALEHTPPAIRPLPLNEFNEPLTGAYHRLPAAGSDAAGHFTELLTQCASDALRDAGLDGSELTDSPLFVGSSSFAIANAEQTFQQALNSSDPDTRDAAFALPLSSFSQTSQVLREQFDWRGPDYAFNTACTASSNALLAASRALRSGAARYAIVVGIETYNLTTVSGFSSMQLLSADAMRPFDVRRNGLVLGEGCAVIILELSDAVGGTQLVGGASSCDTFGISTSNPDGTTIAATMQKALDSAGIGREQIMAIKAHGTASPMNDNAEAAGMLRQFEGVPPCFCLKPYIGHTLGACGAIELALTSLCLSNGRLPASGGFAEADAKLGVEPLRQPMQASDGYMLLNYFGFGGNNSSLVIQHSSSSA